MKINLIAETHEVKEKNGRKLFVKKLDKKDALEDMCGKYAGVCYMKNTYDDLRNEPREKTLARIAQTKNNGQSPLQYVLYPPN